MYDLNRCHNFEAAGSCDAVFTFISPLSRTSKTAHLSIRSPTSKCLKTNLRTDMAISCAVSVGHLDLVQYTAYLLLSMQKYANLG